MATAGAALLGLALGWAGSTRLVPGHSLLQPTLGVLGVGAVIVLVAWVVACFAYRVRWLWTFAVTLAVCTVLAAAWTFFCALPVTLILDTHATDQARAALAEALSQQDAHGVAAVRPCTVHLTRSVGPLTAPYHECTTWSPLAHDVTFEAWGPGRSGGLAYIASVRPGVTTLADQCVRHLVGNWWMYGNPSDAGGDPGQCPVGYRFEGGG